MRFIWICALVCIGFLCAQPPVRCRGPLSEEQLADLIRSHVPETRIRLFVTTCDVSFVVDGASLGRLRNDGASAALLDLIANRAKRSPRADAGAGLKFEFVRIPAGEFSMGSEEGEADERPVHRVRITKAFEMGKYEVTQAVWEKAMGSNPSHFKGPDRPVEKVSWHDIQDFLRKLNGLLDGYHYRLPTEAEWEYAARAGSTGEVGGLDLAAWQKGNSGGETHPVGTKLPNAWGLYDMLGNVNEWCQDWHGGSYYRDSPEADPSGPVWGTARIVRGGSFLGRSEGFRVAARYGNLPSFISANLGFRLVREGSQ